MTINHYLKKTVIVDIQHLQEESLGKAEKKNKIDFKNEKKKLTGEKTIVCSCYNIHRANRKLIS